MSWVLILAIIFISIAVFFTLISVVIVVKMAIEMIPRDIVELDGEEPLKPFFILDGCKLDQNFNSVVTNQGEVGENKVSHDCGVGGKDERDI